MLLIYFAFITCKADDIVLAVYAIGDTGPAGGLIFYDRDFYLEAAPSDQSTGVEWGCYGTTISGADGMEVGTGAQNTIDIEAGCSTDGTAADICANLSLNGYTDWFLPSIYELNLMHVNLMQYSVGGFAVDNLYWSSSEYDKDKSYYYLFSFSGNRGRNDKFASHRVRAARAF